MKDGDFLFSLKHNNKEAIAESSFSAKVKKFSKMVMVFQYIYEIYQHILGNHFVFLKSYGKTNKETLFKDVAFATSEPIILQSRMKVNSSLYL